MNKSIVKMALVIGAVIIVGLGMLLLMNSKPEIKKAVKPSEKSIVQIEEKTSQAKQQEVGSKEDNVVATIVSKEGQEIKALIVKLGDDDIYVSQEAAGKLALLGKKAVPILVNSLPENNLFLKGQITFLLGRIGDKEAVPELIKLTNDENAYIRRNAVEALGKIKDESTISVIERGLFDDDSTVRQRSAGALGQLQDSRVAGSLLNRLSDETEREVKFAVVEALGKSKNSLATPALLKELKSDAEGLAYNNDVVFALGEIGDKSALPGLNEHLKELKQFQSTDELVIFEFKQAIQATEDAIKKIQMN
ncbi:MAG: HEAT repeat domain-containing protein [Candidatus Omnitrophota bacterium]